MKKLLITFLLVMLLTLTMVVVSSAQEITVVDDGTTEITLGDCVIEGLDREIPSPSNGFTYVLNTETKTAEITSWANTSDVNLGKVFSVPSIVTYGGIEYTVTAFCAVGKTNGNNKTLVTVAIPDTVTAIPNNAFDDCRALRYVYVGRGVETIGQYCFRNAGFTASDAADENGVMLGNIVDFIWKTTKVRTLTKQCFFHMDFNAEHTVEFPFDRITKYDDECLAYNQHAFQSGHHFNKQLYLDTLDLRNATLSTSAFNNAIVANTIIINAEQASAISPQKLRGQGTSQPDHYTHFVIYGGETPATAKTLTGGLWTANAWYWGSDTTHYSFYFRGYVNAYDGTDGLENQNGYNYDVVDYFFESEEAFYYYLNSVKTTTNASDTLTRYAKCNKGYKGYFNVCDHETGTAKAYDITYVENVVGVVEVTDSKYLRTAKLYSVLLDGYCTESTFCYVCDYISSEGIKHEYKTTVAYSDFTQNGTKTTGCTHDYCALYANPVVVELGAIFSEFYYSVREDETLFGLVMTYKVNNEALAEYETVNGHLNFGVMAIAKKRITTTEGESEVITNPLKNDGTTELSNVVVANVSSNTLASVNLIITGSGDAWEEAKGVEFYVLGFAVNGEALQYFQNSSNTSIGELSTITYNDAKEVA